MASMASKYKDKTYRSKVRLWVLRQRAEDSKAEHEQRFRDNKLRGNLGSGISGLRMSEALGVHPARLVEGLCDAHDKQQENGEHA